MDEVRERGDYGVDVPPVDAAFPFAQYGHYRLGMGDGAGAAGHDLCGAWRGLLAAHSDPAADGGDLGAAAGILSAVHARERAAGRRPLRRTAAKMGFEHRFEISAVLRVSGATVRSVVAAVSAGAARSSEGHPGAGNGRRLALGGRVSGRTDDRLATGAVQARPEE